MGFSSLPLTSPYFYTYTLGSSLYVPLTSRCNTRTLPQTRGPNFMLPASVVAALCRVRDAEQETDTDSQTRIKNWKAWCNWLDMQDCHVKLPPAAEGISELPDDEKKSDAPPSKQQRRPTVEELLEEVQAVLQHEMSPDGKTKNGCQHPLITSLVIAGEGEPTLRFNALTRLSRALKDQTSLPIRLTTNGLIIRHDSCDGESMRRQEDAAEQIVQQLVEAKIDSLSVALMTHDATLYKQLMDPLLPNDINDTPVEPHDRVCRLIQAAVGAGLHVETTAVDRPEIDKSRTENLATQLGVQTPIRWRSYYA